jgi:hypothetical protein
LTRAVVGKRLDATSCASRRELERLQRHTLRVGEGAVFAVVLNIEEARSVWTCSWP